MSLVNPFCKNTDSKKLKIKSLYIAPIDHIRSGGFSSVKPHKGLKWIHVIKEGNPL